MAVLSSSRWRVPYRLPAPLFAASPALCRSLPSHSHTHTFLQIWDIRKHAAFERRLTAHQGPVFCLRWHPDDKSLIASGGRDRMIQVRYPRVFSDLSLNLNAFIFISSLRLSVSFSHFSLFQVWDLNGQQLWANKGKPVYSIQTVLSVAHLQWRPGAIVY